MLIVLDYDDTYTKDSKLWDKFINMAIMAGHEVICATMRYPNEGQYVEQTIGKLCKIIYTSRQAKKPYLIEQGINPDIWIDDRPEWILVDSR